MLIFSDMHRLNTVDAEPHDPYYHNDEPRRASYPAVNSFGFQADRLDRSKEMLDLSDEVENTPYYLFSQWLLVTWLLFKVKLFG